MQKQKYDQTQQDHNGDTPLHTIVVSGISDKIDCLMVLMVHSIYGSGFINAPGNNGNSALYLAVQVSEVY